MGLLNKIKGEFVDIVEWLDPSNDSMVYRFERYQNEIKYGAKLVVRESQNAVFMNEGQIADVYQPGTFTLTTQNMPIMTTLRGWKYGFNSPFKAEVYFVNTKNFTDLKWGTKNPIMMRDPEFGPVRLRAFGNYAMRVHDAAKFVREITGTNARFTTDGIIEQLKDIIITRFSDMLAESKIPAIDMAAHFNELSGQIQKIVNSEFGEYGLEVSKLLIENISFPPEVEQAIDKRNSMGVIGNMQNFMQYQAATSMETAAKNPSGTAGEGIGLGMGFAMANQMAQMTQQAHAGQGPAGAPPLIPNALAFYVAQNNQQTGPFTLEMLQGMALQKTLTKESLVWKQGMAAWAKAADVAELAPVFSQVPPTLP